MLRIAIITILFFLSTSFAAQVNPSGDSSCPISSVGSKGSAQAVSSVVQSVVSIAQTSMGIPSAASTSISISGKVGAISPSGTFTGGGNTSSAVPQAPFGPSPAKVVQVAARTIVTPLLGGVNFAGRVVTLPQVGGRGSVPTSGSNNGLPTTSGSGTSPTPSAGGGGNSGDTTSCTTIQVTTQLESGGPIIPGINNNTSQVCTNGQGGVTSQGGAC